MNFWLQPRTFVAYGVSILALAEIIDLTIVAVAIPQMMGSLGATIDTIAMVTTAYIVAAAVFILLSGVVIKKYGMRRVVILSGLTFLLASILCALSTSLPEIIFYRVLQGIGGAFLPSVAQSYISQKFEGKEQAKVMTIFSLVVVMGPIIGPVLGGILVLNMSWRWIFYVNVPICVAGLLLIFFFMEKTTRRNLKLDYISFLFMALGIGLLEYFIDMGNQHDWFNSISMILIISTSIILIGFFIWRGCLGYSILNFNIFKNFNFILSCFTVFIFMVFATSSFAYFPTMMQNIYNFPADTAGYISAPRGIAAVITALCLPKLISLIGEKLVLFTGIISFSLGCLMLSYLGTTINIPYILTSMTFQGFGLMSVFVPLLQVCFINVPTNENSDASGVFNFSRNFGASVGTSLAATIIAHQMQVNYSGIGSHVSPFSTGYIFWEQNITHIDSDTKIEVLNVLVKSQSAFLSYLDTFYLSAIALLLIIWIPFVLKEPIKVNEDSENEKEQDL
jgi:MFS transporter, DHA2 family, multidrug resistance protein